MEKPPSEHSCTLFYQLKAAKLQEKPLSLLSLSDLYDPFAPSQPLPFHFQEHLKAATKIKRFPLHKKYPNGEYTVAYGHFPQARHQRFRMPWTTGYQRSWFTVLCNKAVMFVSNYVPCQTDCVPCQAGQECKGADLCKHSGQENFLGSEAGSDRYDVSCLESSKARGTSDLQHKFQPSKGLSMYIG